MQRKLNGRVLTAKKHFRLGWGRRRRILETVERLAAAGTHAQFESRMSMEGLIRNAIDVFIDGAPAVPARPWPDERPLGA